jgi:hypothetical protein
MVLAGHWPEPTGEPLDSLEKCRSHTDYLITARQGPPPAALPALPSGPPEVGHVPRGLENVPY